MTKTFFSIMASMLMVTSFAQADDCFDCFQSDCDRFCDECTPGILKCAQPLDCRCGFFAGADYLYWNACRSDLDYATDAATGGDVLEGKVHVADHDWDSGLRLFGGYRFGCDGWDARAIYTYWKNSANDSAKASNDHLKPNLLAPDWGIENAGEAVSKIDLEYHAIDALLSRPFCISQTLNTRPFFGFRYVELDQDIKAIYKDGTQFTNHHVVAWKSEYCGAGLHSGMDWSFKVCDGLALNSTFAGSIVVGDSDTHQKQVRLDGSGPDITDTRVDVKATQCIALPGYNLGVNMSWENCCDCFYYIVSVGYEMNQWFHVPQLPRYTNNALEATTTSSASGSLVLHGLTVRSEFHF